MSGRVAIVGAGPGDPGLMTARALELVARADVILYDRLIPPQALAGARADAELIYVGKQGGGAAVPQEETIALLLDRARAGAAVVRLKGGDPFVFGRGGEEARALRAAGVDFEIVPGVTAGIAAPAYAGIPVTDREHASAVAFVTAHEDPDREGDRVDYEALARFPGTLVFYMGVRRLEALAQRLIAAGRDGTEPAAVIERGTLPGQRTVRATLATVAARAAAAGVAPPALTVVGDVAGLADELDWLGRAARPLHGITVTVTRARAQASELSRRLRDLGAAVVETPAIRIEPLAVALPDPLDHDLVCFTSANGVALLFERLAESGRDARALAGTTIAAIGAGTARELRAHGLIADLVPERAVAEGLVEALAGRDVGRALIARAATARDVLPLALRERGAEVDVVDLYETVAEPIAEPLLAAARDADYVTFTSASTVGFFLAASGGEAGFAPATRLVSIGPVTSAALREHGLEPAVEAQRHDVDGMLDALLADVAAR